MADDPDEKAIEEEVKGMVRAANRDRVRRWRAEQRAQRAQQAASQMPLHQMLAMLKQKELELQRLQQQYKVSCQQESLRAAHSSPKPFVTPPHAGVKHARSGGGQGGRASRRIATKARQGVEVATSCEVRDEIG